MSGINLGYSTRSKFNGNDEKSDIKGNGKGKGKQNSNATIFEYPPDGVGPSDSAKSIITFTEHDERKIKAPAYLNDTNISFFMQYHLDNHVEPEVKNKIYIFNSFFFAKINSLKSKQKNNSEKISYKCASRWLSGVKIFDKDFLIMPVCEKKHWVLVIIAYPGRVPKNERFSIADDKLFEPAVFVLNSWPGTAPSVKKVLNQFLAYQWNVEKKSDRRFPIESAKNNGIRLLFPKLPQQENSYNCGVYILNYLYCFLKSPRESYIRMFRKRDMSAWFLVNGIDIRKERARMREIIESQKQIWNKSETKAKRRIEEQEIVLDSSSESNSSPIHIVD